MPVARVYTGSRRRSSTRSMKSSRRRSKSVPRRRLSDRTSYSMGTVPRKFSVTKFNTAQQDLPTIPINVSLPELKADAENEIRRRKPTPSILNRLLKRKIRVEALHDGIKDYLFYAPLGNPLNKQILPTEFIKIKACPENFNFVKRTDDFEITFVGMSVTCQEPIQREDPVDKRYLFYSLKSNPNYHFQNSSHQQDGPCYSRLAPDDVPYIHYDAVVDNSPVEETGETPNSSNRFIRFPPSKSVYHQNNVKDAKKMPNGLTTVPIRISAMHVDELTYDGARAIRSNDNMKRVMKSTGVPYLRSLSMAAKASSNLSKEGSRGSAKPQLILSKDISFLLSESDEDYYESRSSGSGSGMNSTGGRIEYGNFLRYGYYFFLDRKIDAKLYAETDSTSHVSLLLRRCPYTKQMRSENEKEFLPLSGVNYICMKVSPGTCQRIERNSKATENEHRLRLENIYEMSNAIDLLLNARRT